MNQYVGLQYLDGLQDCYGLVRRFYLEQYGLKLRNYARPVGFDHQGLNLLEENFKREGFEIINVPRSLLEPGDGLLFSVLSKVPNHVGVIVDNLRFLHHLYGRSSSIDWLDPRWEARLVAVVRHPDVSEINRSRQGSVSALDLLPPHLRNRLVQP